MTEKKRTVLQPEYLKNFTCIGSACEDSCCIGWQVDLDKKTYLAYKKMNQPELKSTMEKMVSRKHNKKSDESYGRIKMEKNGRCPFLNEKNLCKTYIYAGEKYLSETCTIYPRTVKKVDGKYERSATTSCPEIARLSLLNSEGIGFEQIVEEDEKIKIDHNFDTEGHLFLNKPQRYFWDIRMFSISLLQNRNYTLDDRLVMLGIIYKKIEVLQLESRIHELPILLQTMENMIIKGSYREKLKKIPTNSEVQMQIIKEMIDQKTRQGISSQRYIQILDETLKGVHYTEAEDIEHIIKNYDNNFKEYLEPYLKEKEYILENYLVNEYFKEIMPFGSYKTIWDSYIFLCVLYGMVKFHMIGMSGYHKGLTDDLVIKLIQSLSKVILHNNLYIQRIIHILKESGYDSLAYMSILAKN